MLIPKCGRMHPNLFLHGEFPCYVPGLFHLLLGVYPIVFPFARPSFAETGCDWLQLPWKCTCSISAAAPLLCMCHVADIHLRLIVVHQPSNMVEFALFSNSHGHTEEESSIPLTSEQIATTSGIETRCTSSSRLSAGKRRGCRAHGGWRVPRFLYRSDRRLHVGQSL